jgi:hypothetical protein
MMTRKLRSKIGLVAAVPLAVGAVACENDLAPDDPVIDEPIDEFDDGLDDDGFDDDGLDDDGLDG